MFQFTTTNILNSNVLPNDANVAIWSNEGTNFFVKGVNKFKKENILAVYKTVGYKPEMAKATFDLSKIGGVAGDTFRLDMVIGLTQGSADSRYANDLSVKGKPFSIDFVFKADASATAEALEKVIKKYNLMVYGDKLLNVSYSGGFITIEATSEYQKFVKINIDKFDAQAHFGMGEYTTVRSLDDLTKADANASVGAAAEGYFVGKEGFGTYSFLLHNLSLPTCDNSRAFAPNRDARPIPGAVYDQFVIHYCVNRGVLGDNAVGDNVKSITTHVFYVKNDLSEAFENAMKSSIGTPIEAGKKGVADPIAPEISEARATAEKLVDEKIATLKKDNSLK